MCDARESGRGGCGPFVIGDLFLVAAFSREPTFSGSFFFLSFNLESVEDFASREGVIDFGGIASQMQFKQIVRVRI